MMCAHVNDVRRKLRIMRRMVNHVCVWFQQNLDRKGGHTNVRTAVGSKAAIMTHSLLVLSFDFWDFMTEPFLDPRINYVAHGALKGLEYSLFLVISNQRGCHFVVLI